MEYEIAHHVSEIANLILVLLEVTECGLLFLDRKYPSVPTGNFQHDGT